MQCKPGDIIQVIDRLFIAVEVSNGIVYATDMENQDAYYSFFLNGQNVGPKITIHDKPDNVEWLFLKRRIPNVKIRKGF